jgi:DMSO/TMAO reductase YedYZ molybdopterin-dependent catalytic subunit
MNTRPWIHATAALMLFSTSAFAAEAVAPRPKNLERDLIRRSERPTNYETPIEDLNSLYTPANKLFVRSHLPNTATTPIEKWEIRIEGEGIEKPMKLSIEQLKNNFPAVEIPAVVMCAGNRRSEFQPRVTGVQWGKGAIGNGLWKGVRLKDILQKAGVKPSTIEVAFNGADFPSLPGTPDFIKSIPLTRALDDSTLLAYEYNGAPLPLDNGYPVRLVVPGWVATYWVKQVVEIHALTKPSDSFWMKKAYRIDKGKFPAVEKGFASQENETSAPITEMVVNSIITNLQDGQKLKVGREFRVQGFAWDGGRGIQKVEVSIDGGATWTDATLGAQPGPYSWRQFTHAFKPAKGHEYRILARATNGAAQTQPAASVANGPGYHNNSTYETMAVAR